MKVYSALISVDYEGEDLLGVFGSREEAVEFCRNHDIFDKYSAYSFGVVESELGQPIDFHAMVEWVE